MLLVESTVSSLAMRSFLLLLFFLLWISVDGVAHHDDGFLYADKGRLLCIILSTTSVAGRKPFGGITPKGEARWKELSAAIRENRANNAEKIREIEEKALVMVREFTKRIEKEAKKKAKGG